jgi:hypothetical protein
MDTCTEEKTVCYGNAWHTTETRNAFIQQYSCLSVSVFSVAHTGNEDCELVFFKFIYREYIFPRSDFE